MTLDLPTIWALLLAVAILMYVVMDGFDLGIGIIFPFIGERSHRDRMINTIAPVWDGNETWLILGGGGLFAVFPLAYSLIMTALYMPLIIMLLALVFRGVAFEFRFKSRAHKGHWDFAFAAGSIVATFCQGIVLGAFVQGIEVSGRSYIGGWFDWLTPFSIFCGVALILGYALLGASWLIMKTDGRLRENLYNYLPRLLLTVLVMIAGVSLWTPLLNAEIAERWFSWPNIALLSPVPILVGLFSLLLYRAIIKRRDNQPFIFSLGLFILSVGGFGISLYPMIVPPSIDIWEAAAPASSQAFLLVGAVVLLPIILGYTGYVYWVFRGKTRADEGYHDHA